MARIVLLLWSAACAYAAFSPLFNIEYLQLVQHNRVAAAGGAMSMLFWLVLWAVVSAGIAAVASVMRK